MQIHLTDMPREVGDAPAGAGRHCRGLIQGDDSPKTPEVGRQALEISSSVHAPQFTTYPPGVAFILTAGGIVQDLFVAIWDYQSAITRGPGLPFDLSQDR